MVYDIGANRGLPEANGIYWAINAGWGQELHGPNSKQWINLSLFITLSTKVT